MSILSLVFKPLAYISLPYFLLRSLSSASPTCRYYIRLYVYMSTLATIGACSSFISAAMAMVGQKYNVNWVVARLFYGVAGRLMEIDVVIEGEEYLDTRPAVLMCNHQSVLDILFLGRIYPKGSSIVAKKSIQYSPIGPFMTMSGAVFIDRGNSAAALRSLAAAGETIKHHKTSLWVFPEGTRHLSQETDLLPFKKGSFHLALQAGIPIVPIVVENYWWLYRKGEFGKGTVKVRVLPPVSTTGLTSADASELANRVRDQMLVALRDISRPGAESARNLPGPVPATQKTSKELSRESTPTTGSVSASGTPSGQTQGLDVDSVASLSQRVKSEGSVGSHSTQSVSENGAETEEDEGMVLVGRPGSSS
jgi:lysophosphatidate acyltransferase